MWVIGTDLIQLGWYINFEKKADYLKVVYWGDYNQRANLVCPRTLKILNFSIFCAYLFKVDVSANTYNYNNDPWKASRDVFPVFHMVPTV